MSYDEQLSTPLDQVRAFIGDTSDDETAELVTDDHIDAVLSLYTPLAAAVAFLAGELAVRFAQQPGNVTLPNGLSVSWAERVKTWLSLAALARSGQLTASGTSGEAFSVRGVRADGYASAVVDEFGRVSRYAP